MILVVDVFNTLYRGTFSAGKRLSTPQGFDITPTYGFLKIIMGLLVRFPNVQKLVFASDPTERNQVWRKKFFADYKGTRKDVDPKQKQLRSKVMANLPYLRALAASFNCGWFEDPEFEADDQMALMAYWCNGRSEKVILATGDRDMLQLVELPYVEVCYPSKTGEYLVINRNNFLGLSHDFIYKKGKKRLSLTPRQFVFWRALIGDKSDNIPGIASAVQGYSIINDFYEDSMTEPWEVVAAWITDREGKAKVSKKDQGILDRDRGLLKSEVNLAAMLTMLRPESVMTRSSFYGSWNPQAIESWFKQVNFRSLLPGGPSYQQFTSTIGRLNPCLLS